MRFVFFILIIFLHLKVYSQQGKVVDHNGQPLPFVNISSIDNSVKTSSDLDGNFTVIPKSDNIKLIFSYIGYKTDTVDYKNNLIVTMVESGVLLKSVEIIGEKIVDSEKSLITEKKESVAVESSIGKQEMSKKNISNAEDGIKKISGITVKSNKINVRGLDDRYNQVTVNKFPIPSNNSDQKNMDLSLLPKSFIGNIKVRKSYTCDQWSNIAGAQIDINTNNISNKFDVGGSVGYNTNNTYNESVSLHFSKKINKFYTEIIGSKTHAEQNINGFTKIIDKEGVTKLDYNFNNQKRQTDDFIYLNNYYRNNNLLLKSISLFTNSIKKDSIIYIGNHFDYNNEIKSIRITPINEYLFLQQIISEYKLKDSLYNTSTLSFSTVNGGEQNRKQLVFLKINDEYQYNIIDKLDNHYFSNINKDNRIGFNNDLKYIKNNSQYTLGYGFIRSNNYFDYSQFYFLTPPEKNTLISINNPASKVIGENLIHSLYGLTEKKFNKLNIQYGVRIESSQQSITYRDQVQPTITKKETIQSNEILPSLLIKKLIDDKTQIKLTSSRTIIRPRFRELTPFLYTEMFAGNKIQGNPKLQNSSVYNSDFCYEKYNDKNIFSLCFFGKYINSPIERVNIATASGRLETYQNGNSAYVLGCEIESKFKVWVLDVDMNSSFMKSSIILTDNGSASTIVTNKKRPLQGSTPLLSNLDVFYKQIGLVYNYTGRKLYSTGIQGLGDIYQKNRHQLDLVVKHEVRKINYTISFANILDSPYILEQSSDNSIKTISKYKLGVNINMSLTIKII